MVRCPWGTPLMTRPQVPHIPSRQSWSNAMGSPPFPKAVPNTHGIPRSIADEVLVAAVAQESQGLPAAVVDATVGRQQLAEINARDTTPTPWRTMAAAMATFR